MTGRSGPAGAGGAVERRRERGVASASEQPPVERQGFGPKGNAAERDREHGAYLVLYALLGVAFFTMAAVVLDIAALRQGRRSDRAAADLAATAGAAAIDSGDSTTYAAACGTAWGYILANRTESGGAITAPDCSGTFPSGVACNSFLGARTATATIAGTTIEITSPVPDSSPLMKTELEKGDQPQVVVPAVDGLPCERLAVRIVRTRDFLFGAVAGSTGATTDVHSVARALTTTSTTEVPGIVALERTGCDGLSTSGGSGRLSVGGVGVPGVMQVDSDGSACGAGFTIHSPATGLIRAEAAGSAPGAISSFAAGGANFARAFDPADVSAGRLVPTPTPSSGRIGRSMIDTRYGGAQATFTAQLGGSPPPAFTLYSGPCSVPNDGTTVVLTGDTYVDCPGGFEVLGSVTFSAGSVGFSGDVIVRAGGCLAVNDTACGAIGVPAADGAVYTRGGLGKEPTGRLALTRTFVDAVNGFDVPADLNPAPDSAIAWTAPQGGAFEDLLAWTEASGTIRFGEQDQTVLEGTVFAPNATIALEARNGPGIDVPMQLVADRVRLDGTGNVRLAPVADRATGRLTRQVRLVR